MHVNAVSFEFSWNTLDKYIQDLEVTMQSLFWENLYDPNINVTLLKNYLNKVVLMNKHILNTL